MKKSIYCGFSIILILLTVIFMAVPVSAHVLKTDGNISALLHINPNDAPTGGTTSSLILYFTDSTQRFTLPNCICNITIQENGQTIDTKQLTYQYSNESNNTYIFPRSDVYNLRLTGEPKNPNDFQPFVLNYIVRVEPGVNEVNSKPYPPIIWIGLGSGIGLILFAAVYQEHRYKRRNNKKE